MTNLNEILLAARRPRGFACGTLGQIIARRVDRPGEDWIAEANRRSDQYVSGTMTGDSWEAVRERARKKAGLDD